MRMQLLIWSAVWLALAGGACKDPEEERRKLVAAAAARAEADATRSLGQYKSIRDDGRVELAYAYAQGIIQRFPRTAAARELQPQMAELKSAAEALANVRRLEGLWTYHAVADEEANGVVHTAYIFGIADRRSAPKLQLVLRRHPAWGQSVYLLMPNGDFACKKICTARMTFQGASGDRTADWEISRAEGNIPPAVFIEADQRALEAINMAKTLLLSIQLVDRSTVSYTFELAGFDSGRLGLRIDD